MKLSQVIGLTDFAGGMPPKGFGNLRRLNAAAVVGDANQVNAAALDFNCNSTGTGVNCILRQLLDDVDRPFHHFTGSNSVDGIGA